MTVYSKYFDDLYLKSTWDRTSPFHKDNMNYLHLFLTKSPGALKGAFLFYIPVYFVSV